MCAQVHGTIAVDQVVLMNVEIFINIELFKVAKELRITTKMSGIGGNMDKQFPSMF